jgi:capsular exopolysaccharide synthesis family protein
MEEELDLRVYLGVLRRSLWWIAACAVLGVVSAFLVSSNMAPVYEASATLLVRQAPSAGVSDYTAILTSERLARTYSEMITGRPVLEAVIEELELEETAEDLAENVEVNPVPDTQLIRLSVEDDDAVRAATIADALANAFIGYNSALQEARYSDSLGSVQEQIGEVSGLVEETEGAIEDLGTPETAEGQAELARLQTIVTGYRNTYATLLQGYEEMRVTAAQSTDDVVVSEPAEVPDEPVRPRVLLSTALAGVFGAMLAVGAAFLVEYLDDTIRTADDVSDVLGLGTLGAVARLRNGEDTLVTLRDPLSPPSEAFQVLRTNLRFSALDRPLRTLLFTSAGPDEGKSVVVANLAVAMAQARLKVILVDGDLRRPRQHELFGLHRLGGLTSALLQGSTDGRLQRTEQVEGLSLLSADRSPPNPAGVLRSERVRQLIGELAEEADVVLLDSPPVLPVADAPALAQAVDGVVLVVDAGKTRRDAAQQAVENLRRVGANVIGAVLNNVPTRGRGGYGNYYYERYGEEHGKKRGRRKESPSAGRKTRARGAEAREGVPQGLQER